jgi:hypothetical protein
MSWSRCRFFVLLAALAAVIATSLVAAGPSKAVTFPNLTKLSPPGGWATDNYGAHYSLDVTGEQFSSAAVGDLDGDGIQDIVAGFPDGNVYVWKTTDHARWLKLWTGPGAVQASPTLVDLNGDGLPDILAANTNGDVVAWTWTGQQIFRVRAGDGVHPPGVFGTPVAADIDKDGQLDIVATSWDHHVHAWHLNGQELPGFPVFVKDTSWSSPAIADIDGDGWPEIVFGFDCDGVQGQPCYGQGRGGYIGVLRHDGSWQPGWPRFYNGQVIWSSPAIADLNGDGRLDIVVGTGNMPIGGGHQVLAFNADGSFLPGWPVNVGGVVMASPAIGDVDGDGHLDVVTVADDGRLYAHRANGSLIFSRCIANDQTNGCPIASHASASIADVDNNGSQDIVVGGEQWLTVLDGAGNTIWRGDTISGTNPIVAAPTVASANGKTLIVAVSGMKDSSGEHGQMFDWTTNTPLGNAAWPTFRQNFRRTGGILDTTPPIASLGSLPATSSSTKVNVPWTAFDSGSGVRFFDVDVSDNNGPWVRWQYHVAPGSRNGPNAFGAANLYGYVGHTYSVRVAATDVAGNVSAWSAVGSTAISPTATRAQPFTNAYAFSALGPVSALDSPPTNYPYWGYPIARGVAARPAGGVYVLDGWGGISAFGGAPPLQNTGYWPGQDVTRGIALGGDGSWGYVLDLYAGLHPVGGAPPIHNGPYWPGQDPTRGIVLIPGTPKANPGGYILDLWGGLHPFGSAPPIATTGYWPGQDVVRGVALNPDGTGYVVDDWGGLHPVNGAKPVSVSGYWPGQDVVRGIAVAGLGQAPRGWTLDSWGGIHPFGSAPPLDATIWGPGFLFRGLSLTP